MSPRLQDELKQTKPWKCLEEEAALNLARTAAVVEHAMVQALKPFGVTPTQYNVLRILRGAGEAGLCRNEIGERLVTQVPDVTRLLDRMEEMQVIARQRSGDDRRFVTTVITPKGIELMGKLDDEVQATHRKQWGHLDATRLQAVISLLELVRDGV